MQSGVYSRAFNRERLGHQHRPHLIPIPVEANFDGDFCVQREPQFPQPGVLEIDHGDVGPQVQRLHDRLCGAVLLEDGCLVGLVARAELGVELSFETFQSVLADLVVGHAVIGSSLARTAIE